VEFDRLAQTGCHEASAAAEVEQFAVRVDEVAAQLGVAGDLPGFRRGDGPPEAEGRGALAGGRVGQVAGADRDRHLRAVAAQQRGGAGGHGVGGPLHRCVGLPVGLHGGLHLLRAYRVEVEAAGGAAVGVRDHGQEPLVGRVGFGPSWSNRCSTWWTSRVRSSWDRSTANRASTSPTAATVPPWASMSPACFGAMI
jgi:hypothetical protein